MRKFLLLLATIATTCSSLADEWQKPVYSGTYESLTVDQEFYIYNTEAQMFLTEGNDWGTHASVGDTGLLCTLRQHVSEGQEWDGKTYAIMVTSAKNNNTDSLFINEGGNVYVDCKSRGNSLFYLNNLHNNTFQITAADANATWNSTNYPGYMVGRYVDYMNAKDNIATGTGVIFDDPTEMADQFQTTWALVSEENYQAYLMEMDRYEAAMELKKAIENAEKEGVTDLADEKAVYANTTSSEEELESATEATVAKLLKYYEISVTPNNPKTIEQDACNAIDQWENEIGASTWNTQTWIAETWTGFEGTTLNIWGASLQGAAQKELTGLPNGIYVVSLAAFSEKAEGYVFANLDKKAVASGAAGATYEITTNVTDGTLTYGFGQETAAENWVALDNVTVTYYGNGTEAIKYWVNSLKESAPDFSDVAVQPNLVEAWNNVMKEVESANTDEQILAVIPKVEEALDNINQNIAAYSELESSIELGEELLNNEYINEKYGDALGDAVSVQKENVKQHTLATVEVKEQVENLGAIFEEAQNFIWQKEKLVYEVATAESIFEEYKEESAAAAIEAYNTYMDAYQNMDWSQKSTEEITVLLDELYNIEFNLTLPQDIASDDNPVDYTPKVLYPSFDNGAEGWTNDGWSTCGLNTWNDFADGTVLDGLYLNLWNTTAARIYQTVNNLPAGTYMLQISAYAKQEGLQVYANEDYMDVILGTDGDNKTNADGVAHIYNGSEEAKTVEGSVYYGNIYQIITKVGEDGVLEIGVRNTNDAEIWAMIDNVKLTYYGTESTKKTTNETAIASVKDTQNSIQSIYTLSGVQSPTLQKGINLVKYNNGTVKKVVVK